MLSIALHPKSSFIITSDIVLFMSISRSDSSYALVCLLLLLYQLLVCVVIGFTLQLSHLTLAGIICIYVFLANIGRCLNLIVRLYP